MSDAAGSDARGRFLRLFGHALIAVIIALLVWGVVSVGGDLFRQTVHIRCQNNLKNIIEAMSIYKAQYDGQLPPYLALLVPQLEGKAERLQCPADPDWGRKGCRPAWLRRDDGQAFEYVDLDGPGLDPETAADRVPCSYLYAANGYPCGLVDFERTWRQQFDRLAVQHGNRVPLVRCYYHLPEQYVARRGSPDAGLDPDPAAAPTYNITAELQLMTYRLDWQSESGFSKPE